MSGDSEKSENIPSFSDYNPPLRQNTPSRKGNYQRYEHQPGYCLRMVIAEQIRS
jgi:hypothetical protein